MEAQVLTSFDGPRGFELIEVEEPRIQAADEVKIRVEGCGGCHGASGVGRLIKLQA